jgi:hypothetical protein
LNSHRSVYKTDALNPIKLLRHLDFGLVILDFGLVEQQYAELKLTIDSNLNPLIAKNPQSPIRNPKSIAASGFEPLALGL